MNDYDNALQPLIVSTTPLDFGTIQIGKSESLKVVLRNPNKQPVIWQPDNLKTRWLTLDKNDPGTLQPGEEQEIKVTVNASSLLAGSYTATLTFTADVEDESVNVQVPVLLTVSAAPAAALETEQSSALSPLKAGLSFVRFLSSSQTLPLAINNWDSQNAVDWTADTYGTNWLTLDRCEGTLGKNEQQAIYVTANTNSLKLGDYTATLTLINKDSKTPMHIQIELHVGDTPYGDNGPKPPPKAYPPLLVFDSAKMNANTVSQEITITIKNENPKGQVYWNMDDPGMSWLKMDTQIKNILLKPNEQRKVIMTFEKSGLQPGHYDTTLLPKFSFEPIDPTNVTLDYSATPVPVTLIIS